jgi:hypothetical protein
MQFPLANGKKWKSETKYPFNGGDWRQENFGHVVGWEKLTVPAGTFDVIKIEIRGYWHLQHSNSRMVGGGAFTEALYYAPQVRQFIKREINRMSPHNASAIMNYGLRERWELMEFSN